MQAFFNCFANIFVLLFLCIKIATILRETLILLVFSVLNRGVRQCPLRLGYSKSGLGRFSSIQKLRTGQVRLVVR